MISSNFTKVFTSLPIHERSTIWISFFEAIDEGWMGSHPLYEVLAPLYAEGRYSVCGAGLGEEAAPAWIADCDDTWLGGEGKDAALEGVVPPF